MWTWVKPSLQYLYLQRVPLVVVATLMALPSLMTTSFLRGLADLHGRDVFWVSLFGFLAASTAMVCANLVFLYGKLRLEGDRSQVSGPFPASPPQALWVFCGGFLSYLVLMVGLGRSVGLAFAGFALIGWCVAVIVVLAATAFQQYLTFGNLAPGPFLVFPFDRFPGPLTSFFTRLYAQPSPLDRRSRLAAAIWKVYSWLVRILGAGYFDFKGTKDVLPGHSFALSLFAPTLALYALTGFLHFLNLRAGRPNPELPTLAYLLAALMLLCWILSALTFYWDRYRIPVLAVIVVFAFVTGWWPNPDRRLTDHVFETSARQGAGPEASSAPAEVLKKSGDRIILVAAAGGGIQASAWTAEVLLGLAQQFPEFRKSVRVISGVSGGSVGALFYLTGYPGVSEIRHPQEAIDAAKNSSLSAIAWGLVHPDLHRTILPPWPIFRWLRYDRGWALERMLARHARLSPDLELAGRTLRESQDFPVLLFNATSASKGLPVVFTNSKFPDSNGEGLRSHFQLMTSRDVRLETAVRMSAAFPYVSPAARPDNADAGNADVEYLVDGGYYDNFGVNSLVLWLRHAVRSDSGSLEGKKILVLEIVAFPQKAPRDDHARRWYYQLFAPLLGILNVRNHGQAPRDHTELDLLKRSLLPGQISSLVFRYDAEAMTGSPGNDSGCPKQPPLSWHLTPIEKSCLKRSWERKLSACGPAVGQFLATGTVGQVTGCQE